MKNNEIMISMKFVSDSISDELSFLVLKDITLKALIESIYYGLKKVSDYEKHFNLLEEYLKTRKELQVLYNSKNDFNIIDFTEEIDGTRILDKKLDEIGFVTSSCVLFTPDIKVMPSALFKKTENSYILKSDNSLEYNISSRRLNVIESSVIDIIPPGDMPKKNKSSFLDVIIPTVLSTGGMLVARYLIILFAPSASSMGNTMILMSGAMGVVALVTSLYNFMKQKNDYKKNVKEWKDNYENYIHRKINTINEWQKSDIKYLNSVYPSMDTLFNNTSEINSSIFSRSQNDNDFMMISLGMSDEVKPLFEIKSEKKDNIFYDIYYKKIGNKIKILIPSKKDEKRRKKLSPADRAEEDKNKFLLTDLAYNFANKGVDLSDSNEIIGFNYLRSDDDSKPPLLLDLKSCGALGVISNDCQTSKNFIQHIIFELAYYHSPEDLQFVFFFDKEDDAAKQNEILQNYKYLPHTNELFDDISQFVFDKAASGVVFGQLLSIMNERFKSRSDEKEVGNSNQKQTQIVCVVFYDYDIKETGFSKFLPEVPKEGEPYVNSNGLTFIFIQSVKDKLPKYCGNIVDIDKDNPKGRRSSLRYNVLSRETLNVLSEGKDDKSKADDTDKLIEYKHFQNDYIFYEKKYKEKFNQAFKQLSAIYYTRIAENGKVPSMVTLFELYGYNSEKVQNGEVKKSILESWKDIDKNDVTRNLCVAVGKNEHGPMYLDLYEKADGPHMLVAGTTGSGKSETIITYLIGLCMKFSPMDLNLMLVDMKGGGFSDRLGSLPHCVGAVTDTAGEEEGTSAAYMLKRFLESLNAEIKRRKLLLSSLGVDNVDSYIRALRIIMQIKKLKSQPNNGGIIDKLKKKLNEKQAGALDKDLKEFSPLSHLVLVVDEFTELKRFSSESSDTDFIAEITTIARVGRTLGFHIILVSQNIEGAITDDIRVNSKARICLKVATKQASKEMIDSPVAAAPTMPLNGRAYLLVGTGTRFEYFQSAYTGANKNLNIEAPVVVTQVPNSGKFNDKFYSSKRDNENEKKKNENINEHDTQLEYITSTIIEMSRDMEKPRQIFLPSLPGKIFDETKWG
ncbi:ESX-1 secretion system protein EccCa1 [Ruminiclostridium hungatei]|uniref:ESX-1 secretion system protein EccCa1 n=1 Tax=Ruminiclostridium hungatei TaxID=48256 RepID=A0A1V4SDN1_RUMHU|nr:FtsK/SpoIIIE domain-containing protein [Ruminiclostridium hungatei]OPX42022.1 ESX-1 secretion system protein EccCa1 [Ruminiclostridium hungatei]